MTLNQAIISEVTLPTNAPSVTIPVPSGYTDLRLVVSARTTYASTVEGSTITFNGSNTYTTKYLQGDGGSVASGTQSILNGLLFTGANATANTFGNSEIYIPNYSGSSAKTLSGDSVTENNGTQAFAGMFAGSSSLTSAITSITIAGNAGGSFVAGSSFTLYGISKLGVTPTQTPKATGGDIIKNDGTYWYHAFLSTGAFIPQQSLNADYLVIAGGGSGGACSRDYFETGGGGGAGGFRYGTLALASNASYTATIGAGGAGVAGSGSNGTNSVFSTISATGGGTGAGGINAASGGSGGGGANWGRPNGAAGNAGGYTPVEGYAGGNAHDASTGGGGQWGGAGGGGAAGAGGNNTGSTTGATGGAASSAYSSWSSATGTGVSGAYAGGGGGGGGFQGGSVGGSGGGGGAGAGSNYSSNTNGGNAVANTGSGGGGTNGNAGGNGGSGIVIVRYAMA